MSRVETMSTREKFAIIADDYTGAGDSGVHFSRAGRQIDLLLQADKLEETLRGSRGVSLSTESRFLEPSDAAAKVRATIQLCSKFGFTKIFKKIDSTLRGNPGCEIEAALEATGKVAALVCTAMPETGRTCVDGKIYLDKIPLHETEIAADPFHPISTASVIDLFGRQTDLPAASLTLADIEAGEAHLNNRIRESVDAGIRIIVADAVTPDHILRLAKQVDGARLLPVGAGGFAWALAEIEKSHEPDAKEEVLFDGPILAVMGSLSGISRQQADFACQDGGFRLFEIGEHDCEEDIKRKFSIFLDDMDQEIPNIVLRIASAAKPRDVSKEDGVRVAQLLGKAASIICRQSHCRTVFATGGSTAMGVTEALGIESVSLVDEIMPGVVLGSCVVPSMKVGWFISKAGGFGGKEILYDIANGIAGKSKGV